MALNKRRRVDILDKHLQIRSRDHDAAFSLDVD